MSVTVSLPGRPVEVTSVKSIGPANWSNRSACSRINSSRNAIGDLQLVAEPFEPPTHVRAHCSHRDAQHIGRLAEAVPIAVNEQNCGALLTTQGRHRGVEPRLER